MDTMQLMHILLMVLLAYVIIPMSVMMYKDLKKEFKNSRRK